MIFDIQAWKAKREFKSLLARSSLGNMFMPCPICGAEAAKEPRAGNPLCSENIDHGNFR